MRPSPPLAAGIAPVWWDIDGNAHHVGDDTKRALLAAMRLPADTAAKVTVSALGDVYLTLEPGASNRMVAPGGMIGEISRSKPRKRPHAES